MKFTTLPGRPWTVGEDTDLIEAVERYGTNRWEAVARFLGTRTGRECHTRWVNWLDPQIRTDEWSQVEDAKLRQLSTIFPAQWETISEIFNGSRTALSCLLRHSFLLENPPKISNKEGSSFTKTTDPPQKIDGKHTTNSQPKSGEKKFFLQRSTPRSKIDLGFDNSFSNLNKQEKEKKEKAAMQEKEKKEKEKAAMQEKEEKKEKEKAAMQEKEKEEKEKEKAAMQEKEKEKETENENEKAAAAAVEEEKTGALKEKEKQNENEKAAAAAVEEEKTGALKEKEKQNENEKAAAAAVEEEKTGALKDKRGRGGTKSSVY